jgi:hypothetical protein
MVLSPCSRNARPQKGGRGAARLSFLLAEAARSECAPSMRPVKDSLAAPPGAKWGKSEGPRLDYWHVSACQRVGGRESCARLSQGRVAFWE